MSGPLQARPSCLCRYLPQAVGPYGSSLPCVAPRAASHEAIPLVDEGAEVTPHCTSYSPYQGVVQLLSTPVNVARPRLSPEQGENGCDPPSPYDHDGRINDRLGCGLRRKAGEWRVEGRVPLLAYKLPGTQGCLPGFEVFSPRSRGVSYHSQDGQYGGCVPHKPPRRFKVAHPGQACAPSSPLVPRQVPLFEGGSRSGSTEPGGRFSVETEAQAGGMDVEPSDGIPDLGSVWQSGGGPLCFSRVIPVPALVLPEFPDDFGHRCVRPPMAECQSVRVSAIKADSGSTMQSEGERCPSPSHSPILALPDLVLGANSPLASRRGLATSKQRISHWVRDAISLAYEARNLPSPLSLRAHSTRGVASSQALFRGVPLEDICVAAGWSSPHTFVRFYNLDVDTAPGSQVLSV